MSLDFVSAQRAVDNLRDQRAPGDPVSLPDGRVLLFAGVALHSETLSAVMILVDPARGAWVVAAPGAVRDTDEAAVGSATTADLVDGSVWRHRKGGVYTRLGEARDREGPVVLYAAHSDGMWWVRPRSMFEDGRFTPSGESPLDPDELGL